jgi:hypothetical protein
VPFLHGIRDIVIQGQGKDKAVPRTQKGQTFRKRHHAKPDGINGKRNQGATTFEKGEDIWQDLQQNQRVEGRKANSRDFH